MSTNADSGGEIVNRLIAITLRKFFNFLGYAGVMFILYGLLSEGTRSTWEPLERWVNPMSAILTLFGTLLTAVTVYYYSPHSHQPELFSRYVSAPLTIVATMVAIGRIAVGARVPPVVVNGFALLGIAGGLFRIQRNPGES